MANMEDLHIAASAYYWSASNQIRQHAEEFFYSMDTNGDGGVSFNEFAQFIVQNGYPCPDFNLFRGLDRNGDRFLDFYEVLTFYYVWKTRVVFCARCENFQLGLYFTCVACFDNARSTGQTYDLCTVCYEEMGHQHWHPPHHSYFLDSYELLRAEAGLPRLAGAPNVRCGYCGNYLMELYFTCVACFNNARNTGHTYDLCCTCYRDRRHQQQHPHHNYFLDSYVLLRTRTGRPFLAGAQQVRKMFLFFSFSFWFEKYKE